MKKLIMGALVGVLAALLLAPTASASSHNPTGEFADFGECPLDRETLEWCVFSETTGGAVTIGAKTVPIENPTVLQGGFEGEGEEIDFFGAENGDTLSKTPQPVPGGLVGVTAPKWWPKFLQNWFNGLIEEGFTGVNAIVELAKPATDIKLNTENLINQEGTTLGLPVKVKLENLILGNNCYIGSNLTPMQLNFSTGASGELEGDLEGLVFNPTFTLITVSGAVLVDGTFAAPAAQGCGGLFALFVDPLVNTVLGTPSESGKNAATLEGDFVTGHAPTVRESE